MVVRERQRIGCERRCGGRHRTDEASSGCGQRSASKSRHSGVNARRRATVCRSPPSVTTSTVTFGRLAPFGSVTRTPRWSPPSRLRIVSATGLHGDRPALHIARRTPGDSEDAPRLLRPELRQRDRHDGRAPERGERRRRVNRAVHREAVRPRSAEERVLDRRLVGLRRRADEQRGDTGRRRARRSSSR